MPDAAWPKGARDREMPPHWWDLDGTSFAPKPADLATVLTRVTHENHKVDQTPVVWLLRGGSWDGTAVGSKIFLQPMAFFYRREQHGVMVDYPTMLADMRVIFSDPTRFAFQDQSVPNAAEIDLE